MKIHRLEDFRECAGNVLGAARIEPSAAFGRDQLHADAVPLPFRAPIRRLQSRRCPPSPADAPASADETPAPAPGPAAARGFSSHANSGRYGGARPCHTSSTSSASTPTDLRQRDLRQPRRGADAQSAGDQLQQCEPRPMHRDASSQPATIPGNADLGAVSNASTTSARRGGRRVGRCGRPHQRDRLGQIADIVVRPARTAPDRCAPRQVRGSVQAWRR